jgi:hypothetical protein
METQAHFCFYPAIFIGEKTFSNDMQRMRIMFQVRHTFSLSVAVLVIIKTKVLVKGSVLRDITPYSPMNVNGHFCLRPTFTLVSRFDPEDVGGDMFLPNFG